ncbi:WhiB family transcriptional regulator [Streptomyces anulatus]|uniref:WhiB family transcriptional regulator n=1 Tax=Streptomyces anulatus TaxID=1892 RepID=UPI0034147039
MPRPSRYAPDNLPTRSRNWRDDAKCIGTETELFFPVSSKGTPAKFQAMHMKELCRRCPVREQCLTHALTYREDYGVWGGLDEEERTELLRDARRAAERQRRAEKVARDRAAKEQEAAHAEA